MRSRLYPFLRFEPNADWRHVNPVLLRRLNALGASTNHVIDIFSGYRSNQYSQQVGGFAGDPHTKGIAVDAKIDGRPVGSVIPYATFAKFGLRSGNQPNFYQGKRDPSHVDLVGFTKNTKASDQTAPPQAVPRPETSAAVPAVAPDLTGTQPPVFAPGTVPAETDARWLQKSWQMIAAQPGVSQDTQTYAASLTG